MQNLSAISTTFCAAVGGVSRDFEVLGGSWYICFVLLRIAVLFFSQLYILLTKYNIYFFSNKIPTICVTHWGGLLVEKYNAG